MKKVSENKKVQKPVQLEHTIGDLHLSNTILSQDLPPSIICSQTKVEYFLSIHRLKDAYYAAYQTPQFEQTPNGIVTNPNPKIFAFAYSNNIPNALVNLASKLWIKGYYKEVA